MPPGQRRIYTYILLLYGNHILAVCFHFKFIHFRKLGKINEWIESDSHYLGSAQALSSCEHQREVSMYGRWLRLFQFPCPFLHFSRLGGDENLEKDAASGVLLGRLRRSGWKFSLKSLCQSSYLSPSVCISNCSVDPSKATETVGIVWLFFWQAAGLTDSVWSFF